MVWAGLAKPFVIPIKYRWLTATIAAVLFVWNLLVSEFPPTAISGIAVLLVADFLLGTAAAWSARKLSARGAYQGVVKLLVYLALVALVNYLARIEGLGILWDTMTNTLVVLVAASLLLTEAISVLVHIRYFANRAGATVPVIDLLMRRLESEEKKLDQGGTP